jgi:peptide/nickel transport system substrate-binding protein
MRAFRAVTVFSVAAMAALTLAACGTSKPSPTKSSSSTGAPTQGGTATFAETAGAAPDYIFPIYPAADSTVYNISQFMALMFRPLIWEGTGENIQINKKKSLFNSIVYSDGGKTVTITLKPYKWSDGSSVNARDITFFMNLLVNNKQQFGNYNPGEFPDNVVSYKATGPQTVVFHLNGVYSQRWFTDDELYLITPLPQQAWDRESANGPVGNYDTTPSGAKKVFAFLAAQAKDTSTYSTNPLWQVVDGPWRLSQYSTNGRIEFVPNPHYSGPDKPRLAKFVELPFTSDSSEFTVLRGGSSIDVGYVPQADAKTQQAALTAAGYNLVPFVDFGIDYIVYDFANPKVGPILNQLYVRQALQHLMDQPVIIKDIYYGYAHPTYGPVPTAPPSDLVSSSEKTNPYPFSISVAKKLLSRHGWAVKAGGTDSCTRSGTGPSECGAGITAGEALSLTLVYSSGNRPFTEQAEAFESAAANAGIKITLSSAPFNSVVSTMGGSKTWELGEYGGFSFSAYPTGESLLLSKGGLNFGHYSSSTNDKNIDASLHSNSVSALYTYENYLAKQVPLLWVPSPDVQLTEIKSDLHGVTPQNAFFKLSPEDWYFTKN